MDRMDCLNEANGEAVGLLTTYRAVECTHCGEITRQIEISQRELASIEGRAWW